MAGGMGGSFTLLVLGRGGHRQVNVLAEPTVLRAAVEASETGGGGHGCCKHLPCTSPGSGEDRVEIHLVHSVVHLSHVSAAQHEAHGAAVAAGGTGLPGLLRDLKHDGVPAHTLYPALVHHLLVHG